MWNDKEFFEFQSGNNYTAPEVSEIIFVGMADTFDNAVDMKILKTARDLANCKIRQMMSQILVPQSVDGISPRTMILQRFWSLGEKKLMPL